MNAKISSWKTAGYGLLFGGIGGLVLPSVYIAVVMIIGNAISLIFNPSHFARDYGILSLMLDGLLFGVISGLVIVYQIGRIASIVAGVFGFCDGIALGIIFKRSASFLSNRSKRRVIWIVNGLVGFASCLAILTFLSTAHLPITVVAGILASSSLDLGFWMGIVVPAVIAGLWAAIISLLIMDLQKQETKGAN